MITIAISGGSGSGKTYFSKLLIDFLGKERVCYLSQDHYYIERHLQPYDERGIQNFDTLNSIDLNAYHNDIATLKQGLSVSRQEYVYNNPKSTPSNLTFYPSSVLLLEGLLLFHPSQIASTSNIKVFIDAPEEVMLERRIHRDAIERGYDKEDVNYRFKHHVLPFYRQYILPFKETADLIVDAQKSNFENELQWIQKKIN
ncbi:MAG: uridine kinase [Cytophagales bacterium]|nr:MAG: uridine kinase [Cytophagales bacterium]